MSEKTAEMNKVGSPLIQSPQTLLNIEILNPLQSLGAEKIDQGNIEFIDLLIG
jgi:hypothetical protein